MGRGRPARLLIGTRLDAVQTHPLLPASRPADASARSRPRRVRTGQWRRRADRPPTSSDPAEVRGVEARADCLPPSRRRARSKTSATSRMASQEDELVASTSGMTLDQDPVPQVAPSLLPRLFATLFESHQDPSSTPAYPSALFKTSAIPSKGLATVASRRISRGEMLISEPPLVIWPQDISAQHARALVDDLSPEGKKRFWELGNAKPDGVLDEVLAIRATNGFAVELPPLEGEEDERRIASMIFPRIARFNHSWCADAALSSLEAHDCPKFAKRRPGDELEDVADGDLGDDRHRGPSLPYASLAARLKDCFATGRQRDLLRIHTGPSSAPRRPPVAAPRALRVHVPVSALHLGRRRAGHFRS